jgi:hypothetical protein
MKQALTHEDISLVSNYVRSGEGLPMEEREHFQICKRFYESSQQVSTLKRNVIEVAALMAVIVDVVAEHKDISVGELVKIINTMGLIGGSASQYAIVAQLTLPMRDEGIIDHRKIVDRRRQRWAA